MIREAGRAHEQARQLVSAAHDDTEILLAIGQICLLFWCDYYPDAGKVLDALVALDEATSNDAGFVRSDGVSIGAADFEGAVGEVDLGVSAQVLLEIELLLWRLKRIAKAAKAIGRKQLLFGEVDVRVDNQMGLYNVCDLLLLDAAGCVVRGSVFWNVGPVECLRSTC